VAFLNLSPEAHRAIQISNQGGISLYDVQRSSSGTATGD
jgi:hypothetical protein